MSTNQPSNIHLDQTQQSVQSIDTSTLDLNSRTWMIELHPQVTDPSVAQNSGSVCEQVDLHCSHDLEASALKSTQCNSLGAVHQTSKTNILPGLYSEYPVETQVKESCVGLDSQEFSSIMQRNHQSPDSRTETIPESGSETALITNIAQSDTVVMPSSDKTSANGDSTPVKSYNEEVRIFDTRLAIDGMNLPQAEDHTAESEGLYSNEYCVTDSLHTKSPRQGSSESTPPLERMMFDCSGVELAPASMSSEKKDQYHASFIGPIAPTDLQESISSQEMMDTSFPSEEGKQQHAYIKSYDFSNRNVPTFLTWACTEYLRTSSENFLRGCKWSPDGSQVLTNSNDNILRVFSMADEVLENENSSAIEQISDVLMQESSTVYDYVWLPCMSSSQPDSCRIATTCSGIPIHSWDSNQGKIMASYKAYDQYDEITAAYSLSFNASGTQIFGGYKKSIRIFDTEYPGRKCKLIKTCGQKKTWSQPGQTGIISCFAHSPTSEGSLAAGSYTRHIGLYDLRCDGITCVIEGQRGGITHLMFTPDGNMLLSGARKDNEILCWDMRNLGTLCFSALRDVRTNQRMYFDITSCGGYMTSGNDDGTVTFWDLKSQPDLINGRPYLKPVSQYQAHCDSVNGVSFHPTGTFLATTSGQRHFRDFGKFEGSDSDNDDDEEEETKTKDFSLRVWRMPLSSSCAG